MSEVVEVPVKPNTPGGRRSKAGTSRTSRGKDPETVEAARNMRSNGLTLDEISVQLGVSISTVSRWVGGTVKADKRRRRGASDDTISFARKLSREQGWSCARIAEQIGVAHSTVHRWLSDDGPRARPRLDHANPGTEAPRIGRGPWCGECGLPMRKPAPACGFCVAEAMEVAA